MSEFTAASKGSPDMQTPDGRAGAASTGGGSADIASTVDYLLSAQAVRDRAQQILQINLDGRGEFIVHRDRVHSVAKFVVRVIRERFDDLRDIPYHSRFNHFHVGGVDRERLLNEKLAALSL